MKISAGMLQKLDKIKERYNEIGELLSQSEVIADQKKFRELGKELSGLTPIVECYDLYSSHKKQFEDCEELLAIETDADMRDLLKAEQNELRDVLEEDENNLKIALLPKPPSTKITFLRRRSLKNLK